MRTRFAAALLAVAALALDDLPSARAQGHPSGASLVRLLGERADIALAPASKQPTALVRIPPGQTSASLGVEPVVDGIGRVRGAPAIAAFASAHPSVPIEVAPPLRMMLDKAGSWTGSTIAHLDPNTDGAGVLVGVADTGLDVSHPDLIDPVNGHSRVVWMLDYSRAPAGIYPELEKKYSTVDADGKPIGAVLQGVDIDLLLSSLQNAPTDEVGHGTHVASIAAGNGGSSPHTPYVGVAPKAGLIIARIFRAGRDSSDNDDLVRGVQFIFDRADAEKRPVAVNLSLGADFGPHDGTLLWEQTLASYVGPDKPGHALIAAAGNSGSIAMTPIHQSVRVSKGQVTRVPVMTAGAAFGAIQVWVAMRNGADLKVGLDGPDGEWIAPVGDGEERGKNTSGYRAAVINGSSVAQSPVPEKSHGAVAAWSGAWPSGRYDVTLEGTGTADLYMEATGDVGFGTLHPASFAGGVREGTVIQPSTHPSIIAVGCTVNRINWVTIDKVTEAEQVVRLDATGGKMLTDPDHPGTTLVRGLEDGETCSFSSAGPTLTGVPKPEITAPGGGVIAAMSKQAAPGGMLSIFTTPCPARGGEPGGIRCLQVDALHAVSNGTSMSAPLVTGAVALLFQRDPTLTQDKIVGLLQAGAHPSRGSAPFDDQAGPGELDVVGTLDAFEQMRHPAAYLPSADHSWLTLSSSYVAADGSTPLTAILELRTADGKHRADLFDASRLEAHARVNGVAALAVPSSIERRAPGLWVFSVEVPPGLGGASLTVRATFDGADIALPKTLPIASDIWSAEYPTRVSGGCAVATRPSAPLSRGASSIALVALASLLVRRRRARHSCEARG
jgi:subtilisin family serine protease